MTGSLRIQPTLLALIALVGVAVWLGLESKAAAELAGQREIEARTAVAATAAAERRVARLEAIATLQDCVLDPKFARDEEGRRLVDWLRQDRSAGVEEKDAQAMTKAFAGVLLLGDKVRPADNQGFYTAAAAALGDFGSSGAKVLKNAYENKRFPDKKEWVPLREQSLKSIGKTKDGTMVKFLCNEARRSPEPALQAAAGEALANFVESKDTVRKEIVLDLLRKWGELDEMAAQLGSGDMGVEAQTARDTLAVISEPWNTTLAKLTRQTFRRHRDWQAWYNKNKDQPWP